MLIARNLRSTSWRILNSHNSELRLLQSWFHYLVHESLNVSVESMQVMESIMEFHRLRGRVTLSSAFIQVATNVPSGLRDKSSLYLGRMEKSDSQYEEVCQSCSTRQHPMHFEVSGTAGSKLRPFLLPSLASWISLKLIGYWVT